MRMAADIPIGSYSVRAPDLKKTRPFEILRKRNQKLELELELERYLDLGTWAGTLSSLATSRPGALGY